MTSGIMANDWDDQGILDWFITLIGYFRSYNDSAVLTVGSDKYSLLS